MSAYAQAITPNPNIPCKPGWCLAYVNEAFRVRKVYGTATAAWLGSSTKHRDYNFPPGVWFPVWFSLGGEPAGHVALVAPNGNVYSTSDLSTVPHRHPDLADLIHYYARYGMTLTYLGWTEDVEGTPVINAVSGIQTQSSTIQQPKEWFEMALDQQTKLDINQAVWGGPGIPLIPNLELGRGEYASTLLGAMTDRIVRQQIIPMRQEGAARDAIIINLISALANVAKGEPLDQAKLLAGVQSAAEAGVKNAIESIDTTVTIKDASNG